MFCARCGSSLGYEARFCSACGAPAAGASPTHRAFRRLERPRGRRVIAGVCSGIADHYRLELPWVRVATVLIAIFSSGAGIVAYIVFWIVMPEQPLYLPADTGSPAPPPY